MLLEENTTPENDEFDKVTEYANRILVLKLPKEQLIKDVLSVKRKWESAGCTEDDVTEVDMVKYIFTKPLVHRLPSREALNPGPDQLTKDELFIVQLFAFDRVMEAYPWLKNTTEELKYLYCKSF